jgi:hypothetical protein
MRSLVWLKKFGMFVSRLSLWWMDTAVLCRLCCPGHRHGCNGGTDLGVPRSVVPRLASPLKNASSCAFAKSLRAGA